MNFGITRMSAPPCDSAPLDSAFCSVRPSVCVSTGPRPISCRPIAIASAPDTPPTNIAVTNVSMFGSSSKTMIATLPRFDRRLIVTNGCSRSDSTWLRTARATSGQLNSAITSPMPISDSRPRIAATRISIENAGIPSITSEMPRTIVSGAPRK